MANVLPRAESCLNSMQGMRGEALAYRDEIFDGLIKTLKVETACSEMQDLLKEQTATAFDNTTFVGDSWSGEAAIPKRVADVAAKIQKEEQASAQDAAAHIEALQTAGIQHIQMDLAVGKDAKILVGYSLPEAMEGHIAVLFNDVLYTEAHIVSQDSQLYQATTKDQVLQDNDGHSLPATPAQIETALSAMTNKLKAAGIQLDVVQHPYEEVKQAISAPTEKPKAPEKKSAAKKPREERPAPEDRTKPT